MTLRSTQNHENGERKRRSKSFWIKCVTKQELGNENLCNESCGSSPVGTNDNSPQIYLWDS